MFFSERNNLLLDISAKISRSEQSHWWLMTSRLAPTSPCITDIRHLITKLYFAYLPAATKLGQGNVLTGVCDSVHRGGGVCLSACWDTTPPGADTPLFSRHPPEADMVPLEQAPPLSRHAPPRADMPPWEQTPPQSRHTPPRADMPPRADIPLQSRHTSQSRHPLPEQTSPPPSRHAALEQTHPPGSRHIPPRADMPPGLSTPPGTKYTPPRREADSGIRSTSGRYASYWNAFLCVVKIPKILGRNPTLNQYGSSVSHQVQLQQIPHKQSIFYEYIHFL